MDKKLNGIYICGDIHCNFNILNEFIEQKKPEIIFQVGDLGVFPDIPLIIKNDNTKIYFCPGNHEDWNYLDSLKNNEIQKNIFYMKKGSILEINNKKILFVGGAISIDKIIRTEGADWFKQEVLLNKDIENIPDVNIDIVISHTCPDLVFKYLNLRKYIFDPSQYLLDNIFIKYKPKQWFFGHFHKYMEFDFNDCHFTILNKISSEGDDWFKQINL